MSTGPGWESWGVLSEAHPASFRVTSHPCPQDPGRPGAPHSRHIQTCRCPVTGPVCTPLVPSSLLILPLPHRLSPSPSTSPPRASTAGGTPSAGYPASRPQVRTLGWYSSAPFQPSSLTLQPPTLPPSAPCPTERPPLVTASWPPGLTGIPPLCFTSFSSSSKNVQCSLWCPRPCYLYVMSISSNSQPFHRRRHGGPGAGSP